MVVRTGKQVGFERSRRFAFVLCVCALALLDATSGQAQQESDYYPIRSLFVQKATADSRATNWKPGGEGPALEVSGLAIMDGNRLGIAIRKGEIWIADHVEQGPESMTLKRFASGLHEPLGLLWHEGAFWVAQRSELTRIADRDGNGIADEFRCVGSGWGLTGHYHEYAYGPKLDGRGNMWVTLNIGLGLKGDQLQRTLLEPHLNFRQAKWRGWGLIIDKEGSLVPMCAGMRSPSGIGVNLEGDAFYTDQQGNWVPTNALHHLQRGAFYHHPESLASASQPDSPLASVDVLPEGLPYPQALGKWPAMRPPAVWFPYKKMGQSTTDIMVDRSQGKFGPFAGQLFVGEFTQASIQRVFLEKVDGEYQGACFPFRRGLASAVLRLEQASDGKVFAGLTNRGWSSLGEASYGLQAIEWSGKVPFEIQEVHATSDGFMLQFTQPVLPAVAMQPDAYEVESYTYNYHSEYGSEEILTRRLQIKEVVPMGRQDQVRLVVEGLRPHFVHEIRAVGVKNLSGEPLLHPEAYYTLNRIPKP